VGRGDSGLEQYGGRRENLAGKCLIGSRIEFGKQSRPDAGTFYISQSADYFPGSDARQRTSPGLAR